MRIDTLYVSDMDGTLLDNDSRISFRTAALLSDLSRHGALITVATARTPATVEPLLCMTETRCPAIVMTGAAMWDRRRRELIAPHIFDYETARDIILKFKSRGINPFIYSVTTPSYLDVYHDGVMNRSEEAFYNERRHLELKRFHLNATPREDALGRVILMFAIGPAAPIEAMAEELVSRGNCSVSCYPDISTRGVALLEVFVEGVSKRSAVRCLADRLGVERVVVFGDNLNDLPMMEVADVAVAVENAFPEVKEKADVVIGRNSSDAVARFIESD